MEMTLGILCGQGREAGLSSQFTASLCRVQLEFLWRKIAISFVKYAKWSDEAKKRLDRSQALKKAPSTKSGTRLTMWRSDAISFLTSACDDALLATVSIMKGSRVTLVISKSPEIEHPATYASIRRTRTRAANNERGCKSLYRSRQVLSSNDGKARLFHKEEMETRFQLCDPYLTHVLRPIAA